MTTNPDSERQLSKARVHALIAAQLMRDLIGLGHHIDSALLANFARDLEAGEFSVLEMVQEAIDKGTKR